MGLKIVDEGYGRTPELKRDQFWDSEWEPTASMAHMDVAPEGSTLKDVKLSSAVSMVRMVPQASSAYLTRVESRSKLVPVKPEETRRMSTLDVLKVWTSRRGSLKNPTFTINDAEAPSACSSRRGSVMMSQFSNTITTVDERIESGMSRDPSVAELRASVEVLARPSSIDDTECEKMEEAKRESVKELATCGF